MEWADDVRQARRIGPAIGALLDRLAALGVLDESTILTLIVTMVVHVARARGVHALEVLDHVASMARAMASVVGARDAAAAAAPDEPHQKNT